MNARAPRTGLRITTILVTMVVGTVAIILLCCILLFLDRYRSAMVQSARTSSSQAVSQVSNTVGSYLQDMGQAMELVEQSVSESAESRDWLLAAFLKYRPDVVAVTSYSAGGELLDCWSPGREPRENIFQNLSFDLSAARESEGAYMTAPHVETIFEGYYPWVVTMTAPLEGGGEAAWVSLDISFSSISSYLKNVSIGQRGYCFLMDREGNIVYHPQQQLLYAGLKSEDTEALRRAGGRRRTRTTPSSTAWRASRRQRLARRRRQLRGRAREPQRERHDTPLLPAGRGACWRAALLTSWLLFRFLGRPLRGLAVGHGELRIRRGPLRLHARRRHPGGAGAFGHLRAHGAAHPGAHDHRA